MTWPATYDRGEAGYSAAAVGVMIDESFSRAVHRIRPPGRSVVTTELSIDLVAFDGRGEGSLRAAGEVLAASANSALARAELTDHADAVVAVATTRCRFLGEDAGRTGYAGIASKPPADLALDSMIELRLRPAANLVRADFTPDARCANDLGMLHGGIAAAAMLEIGLSWLRMVYGDAPASSIRVNFVRPVQLGETLTVECRSIHVGRTLAVAAILGRAASGKPAITATATGAPRRPEPASDEQRWRTGIEPATTGTTSQGSTS